MIRKLVTVIVCLLAACWLGMTGMQKRQAENPDNADRGMFDQQVLSVASTSHMVQKLYDQGNLVGVVTDTQRLKNHLKDVYQEKYAADFPDSVLHLGKDLYVAPEESYFSYANVDDQILDYLDENNLFTLEATEVSFADDTDVYARIYVTNEQLYRDAMQEYLSYFIDAKELSALNDGQKPAALSAYGSVATGIRIEQTIATRTVNADPGEILRTKEEVLDYLEYGSSMKKQYYTVKEYDTVAGVGAKNNGLSATQVMNINRDKITSTDQVLTAGEELCVTYFNSPITVVVYRDRLRQETLYPETTVVEDNTLLIDTQEVRQEGENGSCNALYSETWVNGVLTNGTKKSSVTTQEPQNEVIAVGTMQLPDRGTGSFRWPVENPTVTCRVGCYYGHEGTDIANMYDPYGDVYAADRGVIEKNSYDSISGNYVWINHNNGYRTYYGHMRVPSELAVGTIVDKGEMIGHIGMTGLATGPHVHFGLEYNGELKDACEGWLPC